MIMMVAVHAIGHLPDSRVYNVGNSLAFTSGKGMFSPTSGTSDWAACRNVMRPNALATLPGRYSSHAGSEGRCLRGSNVTFTSHVEDGNSWSADAIMAATTSKRFVRHDWHHMGRRLTLCRSKSEAEQDDIGEQFQRAQTDVQEGKEPLRLGQLVCWLVAIVYAGWLFLLPYAPGDPVWAITPSTIQLITEQSLNFFFVLPLASVLANAAGYHGLSAPVQHPMAEALFNLVIGWTLLFGPLLFTDRRRDRFGGSLEVLWIIQMFLTNTVLAPYMAIRQNKSAAKQKSHESPSPLSIISKGLVSGAYYVGVVGAAVGVICVLWAVVGRPEAGFGGLADRWDYLSKYVRQERLAYAFLWDVVLYAGFQPWLIGDNLGNVRAERREVVRILRAVPYLGLVAYVLSLERSPDQDSTS